VQPKLGENAAKPANPDESTIHKGHGRNGASAYASARKVVIPAKLTCGDTCPECARGRVYTQRQPKTLVRVVGQAPVEATVYEMERLRCNACGQVFTAEAPEDIGSEKYDATAIAMIAQLKYGAGVPFTRLERMEAQMGIPLPAASQWELMEQGAANAKPAFDHLIRQAAQGEVLHNDDTGMRILQLAREPSDKRTGIFTSGIVSLWKNRKIALFFRAAACWRKPCRHTEASSRRDRIAHSDVRCPVPEHAQAERRSPDPSGKLHRPWETTVYRYCRELSRRVRIRAGIARHGLRQRCIGTRERTGCRTTAAVSSAVQWTADGPVT
jgi:hypothetical protein